MTIKNAGRLLTMATMVIMAAMLLTGCEGEDDWFFDDDDYNGNGGGDGGDDTVECDTACRQRRCSVPNVWSGPNETIQITSQCQAACSYRIDGVTQGVQATCDILNDWSRHTSYDAKGSCLSCNGF